MCDAVESVDTAAVATTTRRTTLLTESDMYIISSLDDKSMPKGLLNFAVVPTPFTRPDVPAVEPTRVVTTKVDSTT